MKNRLISTMLSLGLAAALTPVTPMSAFADGETIFMDGKGYASLAAAVAAVPADNTEKTITLADDASGDGVKVQAGQNIVFDLGGHTYTVSGETVGSTGTETLGFQLLKGSTVAFKNGKVDCTAEKGLMLLQNYCDLTLDDVTLDMSGNSKVTYVVSNNCGSLNVKGDTSIIAADGRVALDVWYGMFESYKEGVTITFDEGFTGKVVGKIEYGASGNWGASQTGWKDKATLSIEPGATGTFDVTFVDSNASDGVEDVEDFNISVAGGTFTNKDSLPASYLADGFELGDDGSVAKPAEEKPAEPSTPSTGGSVSGGGSTVPSTAKRLAGAEAPETAIAISKKAFPTGSKNVVIARADDFADAMSATGLAGALKCPILTTDRTALSNGVANEVKRLGAKNVYVIGGKGAIPADIEGALSKAGMSVTRVYGADAWDTSVECAKAIASSGGNAGGEAIIATSRNFQDALSISSFAYKNAVPIYLTDSSNGLTDEALSMAGGLEGHIYVVGGAAVVPNATAEDVFGSRVVRMAGADGYDTSNQIATYLVKNGLLGNEAVCVASGAAGAQGLDALAGSALAGLADAPILLVSGNANMEPLRTVTLSGKDSQGAPAFLTNNADSIDSAYVLGGSFVIPDAIVKQINKTLA